MAACTLSQGRHRPCMGLARLRGRAGARRKRTDGKRAADGDIRFGSEYPGSVGLASVTPVTARCPAGPPGRPGTAQPHRIAQPAAATPRYPLRSTGTVCCRPAKGGPCTAAPAPLGAMDGRPADRKTKNRLAAVSCGARDRNRTGKELPPADFKSAASTSFATRADPHRVPEKATTRNTAQRSNCPRIALRTALIMQDTGQSTSPADAARAAPIR